MAKPWPRDRRDARRTDKRRASGTGRCQALNRRCQALKPLLGSGSDTLDEFRVAAGGTVTVSGATDVGLHGAYYFYSQDPSLFGYYSTLTSGHTALHNISLGNGVPLAPYLFTIRPDVTQRLGPSTQAKVHIVLLVLAVATLPIIPSLGLRGLL